MTDDAAQTVTLTLDDLSRLLFLVACAGNRDYVTSQALDLARSLDRAGRAGTIVSNTANSVTKEAAS